MKRRGFFTAIAGAAAGGVAGATVSKELVPITHVDILPDEIQYNGFNIKWTGWKPSAQFLEFVGQWIARPIDGKPIVSTQFPWGADGISSSFPGGVGFFNCGMCFDTCFRLEQRDVVGHGPWFEDPKLMLKAQRHALADIKKFINENC